MSRSFDVFDYTDYRAYLREEFKGTGENRGRRSRLAAHLRCQTSFISQVLTDRAHISLEHTVATSEFLSHDPLEKRYFMALVQRDKAGSKALERWFEAELAEAKKNRADVKERIGVKTELSVEDRMRYYSAWHYSALHVLSALPEVNRPDRMAERLRLDIGTVKSALRFLEDRGFVHRRGDEYEIGSTRIHLARGSEMLPRHHSNWRMKAIEAVDREREEDLHFSAVLGMSKKDIGVFREKLLVLLQEFELILTDSEPEEPVILNIDLFGI